LRIRGSDPRALRLSIDTLFTNLMLVAEETMGDSFEEKLGKSDFHVA